MLQNFASSYEILNGKCYVDGVLQGSTEVCNNAVKGIAGIFAIILIPLVIIGTLLFVFWIITLVHAIKNQDIKDRNLWLGLLIGGFILGLHWIICFVYYFAVMRPYNKAKKNPSQSPQNFSQPPPTNNSFQNTTTTQPPQSTPPTEPTNQPPQPTPPTAESAEPNNQNPNNPA